MNSVTSWWLPRYPLHPCDKCKFQHRIIPSIPIDGEDYISYEITEVIDGGGPPEDAPLHPNIRFSRFKGLFWTIPGAKIDPRSMDLHIVGMN